MLFSIYGPGTLEGNIADIARHAADKVVKDFIIEFRLALEDCAPDSYPCALCFDADNNPNVGD